MKLRSGLTSSLYLFVFLAAGLSGCGQDKASDALFLPDVMFSPTDGLWVHRDQGHDIAVSFREGQEEVRAETVKVFLPSSLGQRAQWCTRFIDHKNIPFFLACKKTPKPWSQEKRTSSGPVDMEAIDRRNARIEKLAEKLANESVAERKLAAKNELMGHLEEFVETENDTREMNRREQQGEKIENIYWPENEPEVAMSLQRNEVNNTEAWSAPKSEIALKMKKSLIDTSQFVWAPEYEFRQELVLFSQPFKFVKDTNLHHSAVKIVVRYRRLDSEDVWRQFTTTKTTNHGTEAEAGKMVPYARCLNLPTTKSYFAWQGDCEGPWFVDHLCNDDTALQIWHAYGNWLGGRGCVANGRVHRPTCDLPWRGNAEEIQAKMLDHYAVRSAILDAKGISSFNSSSKGRGPIPAGRVFIHDPRWGYDNFSSFLVLME